MKSSENVIQQTCHVFDDSVDESLKCKVITKPYTSAPKMIMNDDGLTEISLSNDVSGTSDVTQRASVERFKNDSFVEELIKYSRQPDCLQLKMPYVEDGLSSGSELSSPRPLSDKYIENPETMIDGGMLNSNIIRDITKDIEELRMTITSKSLTSQQVKETSSDSEFSTISDFKISPTSLGYEKKPSEKNEPISANELDGPMRDKFNGGMPGKGQCKDYESDEDTDKLLMKQYERNEKIDIPELKEENNLECQQMKRGKEVTVHHPECPSVSIEGLLFRANYLGSTQLSSEGKPSRDTRMIQAQEAVGRVKAPDSESQPSVPVDLFISTEKILVLNTNLSEIMMDHSLKTISYIADIGNLLVLMARRLSPTRSGDNLILPCNYQSKILCHVFESDEAQLIAQAIGNAFQAAYIEFLKVNGIDNPKFFKDVDYQDVLNDQEIIEDELHLFSNKEQQKELVIPKQRGESLGVVIVESGWGSMIPTVVLANMNPNGPAARSGLLNIGNQIISVNGTSLVGLPLSSCQQIIKKCKHQTAVKLVIVNCPPVVEVNIRRPDPKYQLGFSVQNGVICSLLRGGIAERGGVRVGHHIIEINGISVVAMSHDKIVNILATAIGEIHLRTMPSSVFRLLTGQETPHYI